MHSKNDKHDVVDMVIRIIYEIFEKRTSNQANYEPEARCLIARCLTS